MCVQPFNPSILLTSALVDSSPTESGDVSAETDLSYWSGFCESYQPETFPLGGPQGLKA